MRKTESHFSLSAVIAVTILKAKSPPFSAEFRGQERDIQWWQKFVTVYNGVTVISDSPWSSVDEVFSTDACLTGAGGIFDTQFFHVQFPDFIGRLNLDINCLEYLTIVIASKLWGHRWAQRRIMLHCDNLVSVQVLNSGRTRHPFLADCVRELWFLPAQFDFELRAVHIPGNDNRIAEKVQDTKRPYENI